MHADISKRPFSEERERKHYQSVNMQMGRVQLDSDWNEAFEILLKSRSRSLTDTIGVHGSPNDGFRVEHDLVLDHLDSSKGWIFSGAGSWRVDYLEKVEGFGSFMINGNQELQRPVPSLLVNLQTLRRILEDRGATVAGTPRLLLHYKVSATEDAGIQLEISKEGGLDPIATDLEPYPCNGWQVIELDLGTMDLTEYETLVIRVETTGVVHLDRLSLATGLEADTVSDDFYIQGGDGTNDNAGRYYVGGLTANKEGFETYKTQQNYPEPPEIDLAAGNDSLVYLDVWKRTVTAVEDPDILEVALDGPDTCTREQLVAQVKVLPASDCKAKIGKLLRPVGTGTLTTGLSPDAEQGECDFKPELDYTGLQNSLYRIEIHEGGDSSVSTFKWSRNNGADLVAVTGFDANTKSVIIPSDRFLCHGDWVELCDDVGDLADFADTDRHGKLAKIVDIKHKTDGVKITLENDAGDFTTAPFNGRTGRHPKLRKWHGVENVSDYLSFDVTGLPEEELEHGIHIAFSEEQFYHGDYWQFTARVNTRAIEELDHEPPMGPVHHYAPLSVISLDVEEIIFDSCRKLFPPLTEITARNVLFDSACCEAWSECGIENVQQALEYLCKHKCCDRIVLPGQSIQDAVNSLGPQGGTIYLAPGIHIVRETIRINGKKDITIKGDGSATRVIYLPQQPDIDNEVVKELEAAISAKQDQIDEAVAAGDDESAHALRVERRELLVRYHEACGYSAQEVNIRSRIDEVADQIAEAGDDSAAIEELEATLKELELELARIKNDQLLDLFRVTGSRNITLTRLLMFSLGADSLVAILDESKVIEVSDCDLLRVPKKKDYQDPIKDANERGKDKLRKLFNPCIRVSDGCRINIQGNRIAGEVGLLHGGGFDDQQVPVIDELKFIGNRIRISEAGLLLLECHRARIEYNRICDVELGLSEEDREMLDGLLDEEIDPDGLCKVDVHQQINNILDSLRELLFGCAPTTDEGVRMRGTGITAYIIKKSLIKNNKLKGYAGLHLYYSQDNKILGNQVASNYSALIMTYNFRTRVDANDFEILEIVDDHEPGELGKKMKLAGRLYALKHYAAVEVHFSDRLKFTNNRATCSYGFLSRKYSSKGLTSILGLYSDAWIISREDAAILLVRRFIDLMGLAPGMHLFETLLKVFTGGQHVDWVAYWLESLGGGTFGDITKKLRESRGFLGVSDEFQKNPFVTILVRLFEILLSLQVVSRTKISGNRIDAASVGIAMIEGITLGGVRITDNRIAGAMNTGILWQALSILNNPECSGVILEFFYKGLLYILSITVGFLVNVLEYFEGGDDGEDSISSMLVLVLTFTLFGIGSICPNVDVDGADDGGDDAAEPENPFVVFIRELIDAIQGLIDQLESEEVKTTIKDLTSSDDRIGQNQIHGTGDGIHTNVANNLIESNHIDIEPGKAAVAELFAIGRLFAAHTRVLSSFDEIDTGDQQAPDHSAVASLGHALMNLSPDALAVAREMLSEDPAQWIGLDEMFEKVHTIADSSDFTKEIAAKIATLSENAVTGGDPGDIEAASTGLINKIDEHMKGFGMILEVPGVQVIDNKVEGKSPINIRENLRGAPGGILMTCENNIRDMLAYFLLIEESLPLINIGAQGTRFAGNSLQWGTGYGLSFSSLPIMVDLKIENNEVQNHGLAGIYCDSTFLSSLLSGGLFDGGGLFDIGFLLRKDISGGIVPGVSLADILMFLFGTYKLKITGNEINQCFNSKADEFYSESPPSASYSPSDVLRLKATYSTILGGLMVRNGVEVNCSHNNIRFCGKNDDSWNAYGTVFIDSYNVKFEGNKILSNGRSGANDQYYPRGGSMFLGETGSLTILNNNFFDNDGVTLLVTPKFFVIFRTEVHLDNYTIVWVSPGYFNNKEIDHVLAHGNVFDIQDKNSSSWAKIHIGHAVEDGEALSDSFIKNLSLSHNQVSLPDNVAPGSWSSVYAASSHMTFNGNMVSGSLSTDAVRLRSNKGLGLGNILHKEPDTNDGVTLSSDNNSW